MEREKTEYKDLVRKLNTWKYDEKIHREYYFMEKTANLKKMWNGQSIRKR